MSRIDENEHRRGEVRRVRRSPFKASRPPKPPKEPQLALKLRGGMTAREKFEGTPFNDEIPF